MTHKTRGLPAALLALACATQALPAGAADQPTAPARKPAIMIIVPFTHGGPTDELARLLLAPLGKALQQKVVERNILGAGGTLGTEKASKARPDGTTLLLSNIGQATSPSLYRDLRYDPIGDFEPIGLIAEVPMMLVARAGLPAKDLKGLLASDTSALSYAHAGVGSASHLCGLLFMNATRSKPRAITYQGTQEALSDLVGGHVDLLCDQPTNTLKAIKAGQVRAYGVTSKARTDVLPQVPTLAEAGLADVELVVWHGLYAPKGTPRETIERLATGLREALADPALKTRMAQLGAIPASAGQATPEGLRQRLTAEALRWEPILRGASVRAD
ncbi:tripartite tricarboxylate transporter substrate-binding protein [Aromatoleum diolicum]|uniref:Tripartite tricarboxylate transporter substrate binding protein BugD n=1 Tax=Aromatoleum diolicum TaxID=75796 RepID=A0ABX1QAM2_9RHOO|nr:tripartite tricarboxylate transporter substrate-binding protein [Aromatoleum diolicum]NMG75414.1 tripartite tricarboxylate transporter substrate binding protein BugD [Aromatoleum diolicum]